MLISLDFILSFSALNSRTHSLFISCSFSLSYFTPKWCTCLSIWFFIIDISYTINLLIISFLILDKHSVDPILVHNLLSLQLCCSCMESLLQLFYYCSYSFFLMLYFLSSSSYFSIHFICPLWWCSKMFIFPDFIYCFFKSFLPGLQFLFIFTSLIFKANRFPTYRLTAFINTSLVFSVLISFNIWFIFLDHSASMHLLILFNPLFYSTFTFH